MLSIQGITKDFGAVKALTGADLIIRPGEITALLGANGSGKSTLVKILGGLVTANSGKIFLEDQPLRISSAKEAYQYGIAVAYQDLSLLPQMSVLDNILLGHEPQRRLGMINRPVMVKRVEELLRRLQVSCSLTDLVGSLPSSVQSMLEIAKALSRDSKIILLDEVTASLHHDEVEVLFGLLHELKNQGKAIVMVTHRMNEVFRMCERATILRNGATVGDVSVKDTSLDEIIFLMTDKKPQMQEAQSVTNKIAHKKPILKIDDLAVAPKVKNISMEIYPGELIGIGGLQDQGQAEFIRSLYGLFPATGGKIEVKGKQECLKNPAYAIKKGFGFVSGDRSRESIFPIRTIAENIYAAKTTQGRIFGPLAPKEIVEAAQKIVTDFGVKIGQVSDPATSLSGGNQQKLAIGRWMLLNPDILLLDDPTKGVDISARREIIALLREATKKGMTILLSSSDNEELLEASDRIYIFYEGRISGHFQGADKSEEKIVAAMMGLGREEAV